MSDISSFSLGDQIVMIGSIPRESLNIITHCVKTDSFIHSCQYRSEFLKFDQHFGQTVFLLIQGTQFLVLLGSCGFTNQSYYKVDCSF